MYKLIPLSRGSDDLSIGFDRDCGRRQRELTNNKSQKGELYHRIMLKDVFGSTQCHEKGIFGLRYKLT